MRTSDSPATQGQQSPERLECRAWTFRSNRTGPLFKSDSVDRMSLPDREVSMPLEPEFEFDHRISW